MFAVISARWLGPSDRGIFAIGMGISSFSLLIGSLGVFTGGRVLLSDPSAGFGPAHYWRVIAVLSCGQAIVLALVDIPLWHALTGVRAPSTLLCFAAYCVLMTAASLAREGLHGVGKHVRATLSDLTAALVQLGLGVLVYLSHHVSVASLLACGAIGFTAQLAVAAVSMSIRARPDLSRAIRAWEQTRRAVLFSLPGLFLAAGQLFVQKGDRLVLGVFAEPRDVGIYAAGATIADAAWILPTSVSVIVLRQVAATRSFESLRRWRAAILLSTAAGAALLGLGASVLIHFLLGPQYAGASHIVWVLCVGSVLFASQQVDLAACNGAGRLDLGARVTAWGALTLLVLSLGLMPHFRGMGAALASIGAYGCMAVLARRAAISEGRWLDAEGSRATNSPADTEN